MCWCSLAACRSLQAAALLAVVAVYLLSIAYSSLTHHPTGSPRRHCLHGICVRKCCPEREQLQSEHNISCVPHPSNIRFTETVFTLLNQSRVVCQTPSQYNGIVFSNRCGSATTTKGSISVHGDIVFIKDGPHVSCVSTCFELVANSGSLVLVGCVEEAFPDESDTYAKFIDAILLISTVLSTVALFIVIMTYACLPKLRNLQGKLLVCYLIPMTLFNLNFIAIDVMPTPWLKREVLGLIKLFNILFLFGWLSWLTVICHDIWSTFSRPLKSVDGRKPHSDHRKFLWYSLVGWGCPVLLVVAVEVFAQGLPGVQRAIIDNFTYIAIVLNLVMFLSTLVNVRLHRPDPCLPRRHRPTMEGVLLYLKLALLMGVDWFAVLVSSSLRSDILHDLALILLELQGVFLFVLLICNRRVRTLLLKRWEGPNKTETSSLSA